MGKKILMAVMAMAACVCAADGSVYGDSASMDESPAGVYQYRYNRNDRSVYVDGYYVSDGAWCKMRLTVRFTDYGVFVDKYNNNNMQSQAAKKLGPMERPEQSLKYMVRISGYAVYFGDPEY